MCSPGTVMLQSEVFSHVVSDHLSHAVCDRCLARPHLTEDRETADGRLDRCSGCRLVHYCGQDCQRAAWPDHRSECRYLKSVRPRRPPSLVRLMARTLRRAGQRPETEERLPDKRTRRFADLLTHKAEVAADGDRMEAFASFRDVLSACLGRQSYSPTDVFDAYCRILINSTEICDIFGNAIGTGLYLGLSVVDHSCRPNVSVVFSGRRVTLRATETIPCSGDGPAFANVRVSYLSAVLPTRERRRQLLSRYYFLCSCPECARDGPEPECADWRMVEESEKTMASCLDVGDLKQYVEIGKSLVEPYNRYFSPYSTSVGLHLMKLGKACLYNRDYGEAEQFLRKAAEVIRVSHGEEHGLYQYLGTLMSDSLGMIKY